MNLKTLLAKLPTHETLDAVDDDANTGSRPCPLNNLTLNDVRELRQAIIEAGRYQFLRQLMLTQDEEIVQMLAAFNPNPSTVEEVDATIAAVMEQLEHLEHFK